MLRDPDDTEPTEVDQWVVAQLVPPAHALRRVKPCIDVERCRALVQDCDSPALGRAAKIRCGGSSWPCCNATIISRIAR